MIVIYIAAPFTAATPWEQHRHVIRAEELAAEVVRLGAVPLCPHLLGEHMGGIQPDEWWYPATLELMRRCDVVLFGVGWQLSRGAKEEYDEAMRRGMPVFEAPMNLDLLEEWLCAKALTDEQSACGRP